MDNSFKFIQTSDINLGHEFTNFGKFAPFLRSALKNTFETIINKTIKNNADAILIPGNLFNSSNPSKSILNWVKEKFESLGKIKVFISPGPKDPCNDKSVYRRGKWPKNVHIFRESSFTPITIKEKNISIFGMAHKSDLFKKNPLDLINKDKDDSQLSILMFHGSIVDVDYPDPNPVAPFTFQDLINAKCNYAALGRFHRIQTLKEKNKNYVSGCYSGIPQGISFEDEGEKGILEVELRGNFQNINFFPTAKIKFKNMSIDCNYAKKNEDIIENISNILKEEVFDNQPTKIILTGGLNMENPIDINIINSNLIDKFVYFEIEDRTVKGYDFISISKEHSTRGLFTKVMLEKINSISSEENNNVNIDKKNEIIKLALNYGLDAFTAEEVKKRWL